MNNQHSSREPNGDTDQTGEATREEPQRLNALPFQLIEVSDGVILRRGSIQVLIGGDRALETVQLLVDAMGSDGATVEEACSQFAAPDHPAVQQLIEQLVARQFVVPVGSNLVSIKSEGHLDLFYWHFGASANEVNNRLNQVRVVIIGVNHVARQLVNSLTAAGMSNLKVVDYPLLRNLSFFDQGGKVRTSEWHAPIVPVAHDDEATELDPDSFDCLVATSDFGGLRLMREWNSICLDHGKHFFPVVLQDMVGYVGPSVIPGETACLECFLARLDSNRFGDTQDYASEWAAFAGQHVTGFHPSMASVLGDLATIEITKFYSRALPLWRVGIVMEVNLLAGCIDSRRILRVPRCRACSNLIRRSSTSLIKGSLASEVVDE